MYCGPCFDEYCNGKFRATVGKARVVQSGFRVLIACSGGASSLALVNMIKQGLELENHHRRLRFIPVILHVCESSIFLPDGEKVIDSDNVSQQVLEHLKTYNFELYASRIENIFSGEGSTSNSLTSDGTIPPVNGDLAEKSVSLLLSSLKDESNKEELIKRLRNRTIISVATKVNCDVIFVASSATKLATQLITDVAQGKGNQIHLETGFADDRLDKPILKPLRELTKKELTYYTVYHKMKPFNMSNLHTLQNVKVSIGKATEAFIASLERDFPATVFSVCRISTKVKSKRPEGDKCILCGTVSDNEIHEESSAMAAREGEWRVSMRDRAQATRNTYCYTCSLIVKDSNNHQVDELLRKASLKNLEGQVSHFLLPPPP